jgi:hypothetical protein
LLIVILQKVALNKDKMTDGSTSCFRFRLALP